MSGFSYPAWVGTFYPPGTRGPRMLAFYATRFDAVELNATFRRIPSASAVASWQEAVGDDFRFAVKAHQRITHVKRLLDPGQEVPPFVDAVRGLGERLGPILFQLPPSAKLDLARLETFCRALPAGGTYALETRHESFDHASVDELLAAHGVARCVNDDRADPASRTPTANHVYWRLRRADYTSDDIDAVASAARRLAAQGCDVYAFFKHEDRPDGPDLALAFAARLD